MWKLLSRLLIKLILVNYYFIVVSLHWFNYQVYSAVQLCLNSANSGNYVICCGAVKSENTLCSVIS